MQDSDTNSDGCPCPPTPTNLVTPAGDGHGRTDWFQIGKGVCQGCILSPCLFNLYADYIMRNAGLGETQAGIRFLEEISVTSDMQITPPLWQKVKRN